MIDLIRFVCNEAASVEFIGDIFEPTSCEYTIVVHTARFDSESQLGREILLLPSTQALLGALVKARCRSNTTSHSL